MITTLASLAAAVVLALGPLPAVDDPLPEGTPPRVPVVGLQAPDACADTGGAPGPRAPAPQVAALGLDAAHRLATGRGVRIAVVDTGVAPHPRLGGRVTGVGDYVRGGSGLEDCDGHGTAVAGLLAGSPGGDDGFRGVAPDATLLSIRQSSQKFTLRSTGAGVGDTATLADALVLAVRAGADVVNVSEAGCVTPAEAENAAPPLRAALRFAADHDVVVVAAAGNVGEGSCADGEVALPGWLGQDVLTVGALDARGVPALFGVRGPWVDIAAPGAGLAALGLPAGFTRVPVQGTSFATPFVAGTAALLVQQRPGASAREIVEVILSTARPLPGAPRDAVGRGVVDPVAALSRHPSAGAGTAGTGPAVAPPTAPAARPTAPLPGVGERVDVAPRLSPGATIVIVVACAAALPLAVRSLRRRA
ncbi:type VII secretion-associated serine protease mycosin [Pseudonocardia sp.]|uniref:type VII secretion-associated serine protease mycosin n=1 Tax=Pseudonocardia sp. TaxID=60912 RepID=UPI003D110028